MSISDWIKSFLGIGAAPPLDQRRLGAASEATLSTSLKSLVAGEQGWITVCTENLIRIDCVTESPKRQRR
jgi:hypothetical protein